MTSDQRKKLGIDSDDQLPDLMSMMFSMSRHLGRLTGQFDEQEKARDQARIDREVWESEVRTTLSALSCRLDIVPATVAAAIEECREGRVAATQPTIEAVREFGLLSHGAARLVGYAVALVGAAYGLILLVEKIARYF